MKTRSYLSLIFSIKIKQDYQMIIYSHFVIVRSATKVEKLPHLRGRNLFFFLYLSMEMVYQDTCLVSRIVGLGVLTCLTAGRFWNLLPVTLMSQSDSKMDGEWYKPEKLHTLISRHLSRGLKSIQAMTKKG